MSIQMQRQATHQKLIICHRADSPAASRLQAAVKLSLALQLLQPQAPQCFQTCMEPAIYTLPCLLHAGQ